MNNYKGFHKPYFKCLNCEKMTRIMEDYCTHCDSEIHKTQEEYHEKRSAKLFDNRVARISRGYKEIKAITKMQIKRTLKFSGWTEVEIAMKLEKIEEEIAIESADKEKYLKDIDHIVKTGERLKLH